MTSTNRSLGFKPLPSDLNLIAIFYIPFAGASSLTWVLPDRFSDQEITLEAIHAAINLISAFHDTIINEPPAGAPSGAMELTFALAALQQAQVLVELWAIWAAQKGSISNRYDPLIAIEGFKYVYIYLYSKLLIYGD